MAFTASGLFVAWPAAMIAATRPTNYTSLTADTLKAALFGSGVTPDKTAAGSSTGYNTGTWTTGNELTSSTQWPAGGQTLGTVTAAIGTGSPFATNTFTIDALDTASSGNVTLSNVYGCLVYDSTITAAPVAKQGICFNYFGGPQSVTAGTFTIVWNASGIAQITV